VVLVTVAYYAAAKAGLALAVGTKQVTAVWPPTGLALAALLIWGLRVWPGVAAGALLANITTNEPLLSATGIMVGNTLEAAAGAYLLSRVGFRRSLQRTRDVVWLIGLAAVASTALSATIGVVSLWAGGVLPAFSGAVWQTWWLGDMAGALLVAPAVLVLVAWAPSLRMSNIPIARVAEIVAMFAALAVLSVVVLSSDKALAYVLFPVLFWVAFRLRQPGAVVANLMLSAVAVWFTVHGEGPFAGGSADANLLRAQTFVGVVAVTALLVAAVRTEREHTEDELVLSERLSAELERRVGERTQELQAANRELEAFSYSVSHDLRAPLRAIDGFSRAVISRYSDVLDEDGRGMLERVRRASQRMSTLIDEMLILSRLTRKQMRRERIDLSALAGEIIAQLRAEDPTRTVTVALADEIVVDGDRELVRTLLENLLANAWKFTSTRADARIEFARATDESGGFVVRDNGVGFDMQYADKLFRPFERLHRQDEFAGTGVGLTTVQRVAHRHGGTVRAEAHLDQGAAFYFTLPNGAPL